MTPRYHSPLSPLRTAMAGQLNVVVAVLCLLGIAVFVISIGSVPAYVSSGGEIGLQSLQPEKFVVYTKLFNPKFEVLNGTEYVYQIPAKPRAVLFLAHGCSCKATFFWDKHPHCRKCSGAPEERSFVINALQSSYAVIAVSSSGVCWRQKEDFLHTKAVLENWIDQHRLVDLPVVGLGASSGGYFLSTFARSFKFDAIVLMIAEGRFQSVPNSSYPPVLFVHMPKDGVIAGRINHILPVLREAGIQADEIQCKEVKVADDFFAKRIPYIDSGASVKLRAFFVRKGFLNGKGFLKMDGRDASFVRLMKDKDIEDLFSSLAVEGWMHHLQEELNLAYAFHEFTSLSTRKILAWYDLHVHMPMNSTLESSAALGARRKEDEDRQFA